MERMGVSIVSLDPESLFFIHITWNIRFDLGWFPNECFVMLCSPVHTSALGIWVLSPAEEGSIGPFALFGTVYFCTVCCQLYQRAERMREPSAPHPSCLISPQCNHFASMSMASARGNKHLLCSAFGSDPWLILFYLVLLRISKTKSNQITNLSV